MPATFKFLEPWWFVVGGGVPCDSEPLCFSGSAFTLTCILLLDFDSEEVIDHQPHEDLRRYIDSHSIRAEMELQMSRLYEPELVTIRITGSDRVFTTPDELLVSKSAYFAKAFQECFKEGRMGIIELEDVKEWALECFISWIYTGRLFWQPRDAQPRFSRRGRPLHELDEDDEDDFNDPVTWPWYDLFELYIFADKHDTRVFRNLVIDVVLLKALQIQPKDYCWPEYGAVVFAFENLPDSSPLYRLLVEAATHEFEPYLDKNSEIEDLACLPPLALACLALRRDRLVQRLKCADCENGGCQFHGAVARNPDYRRNICAYHEHTTQAEKDDCRMKWKEWIKVHEIYMTDYSKYMIDDY